MQGEAEACGRSARIEDRRGQTLVEYALILAVASLGVVASLRFVGGELDVLLRSAGSRLGAASTAEAGNGSAADTTSPGLTITTPADGATQVGLSPVYTGTCGAEPGDRPTITLTVVAVAGNPDHGSPYGPYTTACSGGTWSLPHPGPGASLGVKNNRTYLVTARQSDRSGNTAADANVFTT